MSYRQTRELIWTFWWGRVAHQFHETPIKSIVADGLSQGCPWHLHHLWIYETSSTEQVAVSVFHRASAVTNIFLRGGRGVKSAPSVAEAEQICNQLGAA